MIVETPFQTQAVRLGRIKLTSVVSLAAAPCEADNVDPETIAPTTAANQAQAPKYKPGSGAEENFAGNSDNDEHDETPVGVVNLDPGDFPIHALSPSMRHISEELAQVHQVPVEMPAMIAVGIVGGALGNKFTITGAVNGKESHANLYVVVAAAKSSGKGSVAGKLVEPLLQASAAMDERYRNEERV